MPRKGWNDVSPDYRNRLIRGGITREAYERGDSLSSARGHSASEGHRQKEGIWAIVRDDVTTRKVWLTDTTKSERSRIAAHWNYVKAYIEGLKDVYYIEDRMRRFDGTRAGIVGKNPRYRLETRPEGFELLAFRQDLDFESIYDESGGWNSEDAA